MKSNQGSPDIGGLFGQAAASGAISKDTLALTTTADLGAQIQDALGTSPDDIESSEVFLLTLLLDDSSSIRFGNNTQLVRDGHNLVLEALKASKSENDILAHALKLNSGIVYPYTPLAKAPALDSSNFDPRGGTPLYDQTIAVLATVLAKEQEFATQAGVPVRTSTLIISDGNDEGSRNRATAVATIVHDMQKRENHLVAAMGIDDGSTDFRRIFTEMGIDPRWILTPKNDPKSIREAFAVFSRSSVQASQGAAISKMGGFGA